jgi:hypothetical protein
MFTKADLHAHLTDSGGVYTWRSGKQFGLYSEEKIVQKTLKKCFAQSENTLVTVTSFNNDGRAYIFFNQLLKSQGKDYSVKEKEGILVVSQNERKRYFIPSEEISADKGHILLVGSQKEIKSRTLDGILEEVLEMKEKPLIIASHPLSETGCVAKVYSKWVGINSRLGLSKSEIEQNKSHFDALELNPNFSKEYNSIYLISKSTGIPLIANSDSHRIDDLFTNCNLFYNLSFDSLPLLIQSIKNSLKYKNCIPIPFYGELNSLEGLRHGVGVATTNLLMKAGLVEKK